MRLPSKAAGSTGCPFRTISRTAGAVRLMKVALPAEAALNRTVVSERKVSSSPVRSRLTW